MILLIFMITVIDALYVFKPEGVIWRRLVQGVHNVIPPGFNLAIVGVAIIMACLWPLVIRGRL